MKRDKIIRVFIEILVLVLILSFTGIFETGINKLPYGLSFFIISVFAFLVVGICGMLAVEFL